MKDVFGENDFAGGDFNTDMSIGIYLYFSFDEEDDDKDDFPCGELKDEPILSLRIGLPRKLELELEFDDENDALGLTL